MEKVQIQYFGKTALVPKNLLVAARRKEMLVAVVKDYIEQQKAKPEASAMYDKLINARTEEIIKLNRRLNAKITFIL